MAGLLCGMTSCNPYPLTADACHDSLLAVRAPRRNKHASQRLRFDAPFMRRQRCDRIGSRVLSRTVLCGLRRSANLKERSVPSTIVACRGAFWRVARSASCAPSFAPQGRHRQAHRESPHAPSLFWSGQAGLGMTTASGRNARPWRRPRCRGLYAGSGRLQRREPPQSRPWTTGS